MTLNTAAGSQTQPLHDHPDRIRNTHYPLRQRRVNG
jgi:hypothetical protein